ncbi:MAG TPA: carbohydrate ABC transporter permease [Rhodothermales bacterium]|nr:carbohydrate ABC transporter permease [Rhodothermales bacterium]
MEVGSHVTRKRVKRVLAYALLIAIAAGLMLPFLWMVSASLKGDEEIFAVPPRFIPKDIRWDNYAEVFERMPFLAYLRNTTFITVFTILGTVLSSSLVAYAFACLKWPGRDKLFLFVVATMMLPLHVIMVPLFVIFKELHWLNTYKPLIVPAWLGGGAFNIFLLRQFFLGIPKELFDAARIDGCSEFRIYRTIAMPLARPALITVAILTFMFAWNDFLGPLIYLSEQSKNTLALGLALFVGQHSTEWGILMAASILMMIPMVAIFFFFQRYFIKGFTMSGLKG